MNFYHARVFDLATGAITRTRNRALTAAETGVYLLDETNNIVPGERILIEPFYVFSAYTNFIDRVDAVQNLRAPELDGILSYETNTATFWKLTAGVWLPYTPVPPLVGGGGGSGSVAVTGIAVRVVAPISDNVTAVRVTVAGLPPVTLDPFTADDVVTVSGVTAGVKTLTVELVRADATVSIAYSCTATIPAMASTPTIAGTLTVTAGIPVATGVLSNAVIKLVPGAVVSVSFDASKPAFTTFSAYWNGHTDTTTDTHSWDGTGAITLNLPYPASMIAGTQTLVLAADNGAGDNQLFASLPVNVADIAVPVTGAIAFTDTHELVGTAGMLVGVNGSVGVWVSPVVTPITGALVVAVSYFGDLDAETAIKAITGNVFAVIDGTGFHIDTAWSDRNNPVIVTIPNQTTGTATPYTLSLVSGSTGQFTTLPSFPDVIGTLHPSIAAGGTAIRGGAITYQKSGATFAGIKSGDMV